jgi:benzoylformate decarboxylase
MKIRDAFFEVLRSHGITTIFGNPGSNELPLLRDFPDDFRYILALQEGAAIGMADGYAMATGQPSLVNVHAAAGTGNAMGNLTNTQSGHVPVVVTSGQQARRYTALNAMLTNVDATALADPLVKWSYEPLRPEDVPQALSQGILLAQSAPAGPVYISLPLDDWDHEADQDAVKNLKARAVHGNPILAESTLDLLRQRLAAAASPAMVVGPGIDDTTGWDGAVGWPSTSPSRYSWHPAPLAVRSRPGTQAFGASCRRTSLGSRVTSKGTTSSSRSERRSSAITSSRKATTCRPAPSCGP